jgi:hypothetical protein
MTLHALFSFKASPGVTTIVQAMAQVWPEGRRCLVAELDPAGGDLAGRLDLSPEPGLVTLAAAGRRELSGSLVLDHAQRVSDDVALLLASPSARQTRGALNLLGDRLMSAFDDLADYDVLADGGRLDSSTSLPPWAPIVERPWIVLRPTAVQVAYAVSRLEELAKDGCHPGLILVGEPSPGRPHLYPASEVAAALSATDLAVVADDDRTASVLDGRRRGERLLRKSTLLRSARALTDRLCGGPSVVTSTDAIVAVEAPASPSRIAVESLR